MKTGAIIVPQAGFDSVPSDIGTMLAIKHHTRESTARHPAANKAHVTSMRGARFQGGTVDTLAHELAEPIRPVKPSAVRSTTTKTKISDLKGTRHTWLRTASKIAATQHSEPCTLSAEAGLKYAVRLFRSR